MRSTHPLLTGLVLLAIGVGSITVDARSGARLKDIASLQVADSMPLIGYGLVVGLNKTGDRRQTIFSTQTLANMLQRFGLAVAPGQVRIENVAAVMVTADLPSYVRAGARVDVTASSVGDARSLQGGVLLATPLHGLNGQILVLAQGSLSIGGFGGGGGGNSVVVNHLTVGRVPNGGLVQAGNGVALPTSDTLSLAMRQPDFVSASKIAEAVNAEMGGDVARAMDAGSVVVRVPDAYRASVADFVARLETLQVEIDAPARVVINERSGTVVVGGEVRIGAAAVAHGTLSVRISTRYEVSQPNPLSNRGETVVVPQTDVDVAEQDSRLVRLEEGTTLDAVIRSLNALGATPRDIIAIMQALKAAGALKAEIVIL